MIKIAASLLASDYANMGRDVAKLTAQGVDWLHCDIMDGNFVPNISFGTDILKALKPLSDIPFDVHLMVTQPENYIDALTDIGASYVCVHQEACTHLQRVLALIRQKGMKAGVALNPATSLEHIKWVLDDMDLLLIMSVNPGFGGQAFLPQAVKKVEEARKLIDKSGNAIELEVDGGVNPDTARLLRHAGASVLVSGSVLFAAQDMQKMVLSLRGNA